MVLTLIIDLTRNGRYCQLNRGKPFSRRENNAITRKKQMIHHLNPSMPLESNQHTLDKVERLKRSIDYQSKILTFKITPLKQYVLHSRMKIRTPDGVSRKVSIFMTSLIVQIPRKIIQPAICIVIQSLALQSLSSL